MAAAAFALALFLLHPEPNRTAIVDAVRTLRKRSISLTTSRRTGLAQSGPARRSCRDGSLK